MATIVNNNDIILQATSPRIVPIITVVDWENITDNSGTQPTDNADVTGSNTALDIIGQGDLALLNSVDTAQIVNNAIESLAINAGAVTASKLAVASIDALGNLNSNSVDTAQIVNNAIESLAINAGAVTSAKTAIAAIDSTSGNLVANSVTSSQIVAGSITAAEIQTGSITSALIAANTIVAGDISTGTITASEIAVGTITASEIAAGSITSALIAANTIVAGDILTGTITATQIATGTITASEIAAGSITATEINANYAYVGNLSASQITTGSISADRIYGGTIVGSTISTNGYVRARGGVSVPGYSPYTAAGLFNDSGYQQFGLAGISKNSNSTNHAGLLGIVYSDTTTGTGVKGIAQKSSSIGVWGLSTNGTALRVDGKMVKTGTEWVQNLNADRVDNYQAGNASINIPVSNGYQCTNLNAQYHGGYRAGRNYGSSFIPTINSGNGIMEIGKYIDFHNDTSAADYNVRIYSNSSTFEVIGNLHWSGTAWGTYTSDINLKDNVATIVNALDAVNALRGVTFTWKENNKHGAGVVAQEVVETLPDYVEETSTGNLGVDYLGLTGVLIEAVKELSIEKDKMRKEMDALKIKLQEIIK
jgi:hypothetical protein